MSNASKSSIDPFIPRLQPSYPLIASDSEPEHLQSLISHFNFQRHVEGGYFVETDRDKHLIPNPFRSSSSKITASPSAQPTTTQKPKHEEIPTQTFTSSTGTVSTDPNGPPAPEHPKTLGDLDPMATGPSGTGRIVPGLAEEASNNNNNDHNDDNDDSTRNAMTTIHYLLTPHAQLGHFHRNKGRTVHTLHKGRGRYVVIHADAQESSREEDRDDESSGKAQPRIETFVVGQDVLAGEKVQWIVDGGKYKASFILPCEDGRGREEGLLISETVVPGFEFRDHDFLTREGFEGLVGDEKIREELGWLVREE